MKRKKDNLMRFRKDPFLSLSSLKRFSIGSFLFLFNFNFNFNSIGFSNDHHQVLAAEEESLPQKEQETAESDEVKEDEVKEDEVKEKEEVVEEITLSEKEELDDLDSLKNDLQFEDDKDSIVRALKDEEKEFEGKKQEAGKKSATPDSKDEAKEANGGSPKIVVNGPNNNLDEQTFSPLDVGGEEKKLLELAKFVETKIPEKEWSEIAKVVKTEKYVVSEGEYLWKISQKLFGSGFYYSKIWSLNPYITNPHEIEPGMTLVFDMGDPLSPPNIQVGKFGEGEDEMDLSKEGSSFAYFGDEAEPEWMVKRKNLMKKGIYFQYATPKSFEDLEEAGKGFLMKEFEKYAPPEALIAVREPGSNYDATGFDKSSKIAFNFKEGFFLNTFLSTNLVQDFGEIDSAKNPSTLIAQFDKIYIRFHPKVPVAPGERFSIYTAHGKVGYAKSDRSGHKYSIVGSIQAIKKVNELWECQVLESNGEIQRKDRITVYTPKIEKITKTFNPRNIEAVVIGGYDVLKEQFTLGDVVYLDRGRADGVEVGNIFEFFSFTDKGTQKKISSDPTYKVGEVTVISLTDNFATGLINQSSDEIILGQIALSKTAESAALAVRVKNKESLKNVQKLEHQALDELDVELNLDDINEDLLKKADQIQLSEDELEELERQERERSILKKEERDLKELEKLEKEIELTEAQLKEAKVDEDKFLEQQDLNVMEKKRENKDVNALLDVNEIEKKRGRKYMDEELNAKENPYGLTEFDLEEVDELMNTKSE